MKLIYVSHDHPDEDNKTQLNLLISNYGAWASHKIAHPPTPLSIFPKHTTTTAATVLLRQTLDTIQCWRTMLAVNIVVVVVFVGFSIQNKQSRTYSSRRIAIRWCTAPINQLKLRVRWDSLPVALLQLSRTQLVISHDLVNTTTTTNQTLIRATTRSEALVYNER